MPGFLILLSPDPCVSRCLFTFLLFLKWRNSIVLPFPSTTLPAPPPPRPAVVREESRALELCRARSHFGENEEGKAGRSRMLSLQSRRSTSLSIMIAQQSTWVFDERVGIDGAWLAL